MKWLLALALAWPAAAQDLSVFESPLAPLYAEGEVQLDLSETPAKPYVARGPVRIYKENGALVARDLGSHRPALCLLGVTMTLRAVAETCRRLARPDHLRVMDIVIDAHIPFIAANAVPPRDQAEVRSELARRMSDEYLRLKDRSICTASRMAPFVALVRQIDDGRFAAEARASLAAPRLPVSLPCTFNRTP